MATGDEAARFARVKELFVQVSGLPPAARPAWLARACAHDAELQREVEELLRHDAEAEGFLEGSPRPPRAETGALRLEIPGFRRLEPLAAGASGLVYRALQEHPRREVALKVLRLDTLVPGQVARFRNEAEILARLSHPGIAQVYEAGVAATEAGNLPWIAMELVHGRELARWLAEFRPEPRALVRLFESLCAAVQHAHARGIVHRDLKPSNVLVTEAGEPKVLDFGIARVLEDERATAERTRTGLVIGTLAYMAPEQARGEPGAVGPASDVYALGVMLFEALTGVLPVALEAADVLEGVRLVCAVEPRRLRDLRPELSAELETILLKALEKEPLRRYASAGALGADLANWLADRPVLARRPTLTYQARKFVRRNRALTIGALAVIASLALALVQATERLASERESRTRLSAITGRFSRAYFGLAGRLGFGTEDQRKAEELIADIERQVASDPEHRPLRIVLARALQELGDLHQGARRFVEAEACYRRAWTIGEALELEDPTDLETSSLLSRLCAKLGEVRRDQGDMEGRDRWFAEALARDEALVARFPEELELLEDLGWSLDRVAEVLAAEGELERSIELRKRRLRDAEELVRRAPDEAKYVYNLSHISYFLAPVDASADHMDVALQHARRNHALRPDDRVAQVWLGHVLLGRASGSETRASFELAQEARQLADRLVSEDPGRFEHLELLEMAGCAVLAQAAHFVEAEQEHSLRERQRELAQRAALSPGLESYAGLVLAHVDLLEAQALARGGEDPRDRMLRAQAWGTLVDLALGAELPPQAVPLLVKLLASVLRADPDEARLAAELERRHGAHAARASALARELSACDPSTVSLAELDALRARHGW